MRDSHISRLVALPALTLALALVGSTENIPATSVTPGVSWGCFSAVPSGAADSSGDCPALRPGAHAAQTGQIVSAAPSNLTAIVQGTTVILGWGVPPGSQPTSYVVEAGTVSGSSNITAFDTGSSATALTVHTVPPGTYFVRVRGRDASGAGPASNEVTVVVVGAAPPPGPCQPQDLTATVIGSQVAIEWDAPGAGSPQCGFDRYLIQVGSAPGASNLAQIETLGLIPFYGADGVAPGTYFIRVRSRGATLVSDPSNEVAVTVTGILPPGTTRWAGLVVNGEGLTVPNDEDCGLVRADVTITFVQSGASVYGILVGVLRVAGTCTPLLGFTFTETFTGTATGSLVDGTGTVSLTGSTGSTVTGTFSNGRLTATTAGEDGSGTLILTRR